MSNKSKYMYHSCDETRHFRANCPKKYKGQQFKKIPSRQGNVAADITHEESEDEEDDTQEHRYCLTAYVRNEESVYCLDLGASEHLVSDDKILRNLRDLRTPVKIKSAKSSAILTASKIGDIYVKSIVKNNFIDIVITDILFVPGLETNLFSVCKLEINGFTVVFRDGKETIQKGNKVIADRKSKLYELNFLLDSESANLCRVEKNSEL